MPFPVAPFAREGLPIFFPYVDALAGVVLYGLDFDFWDRDPLIGPAFVRFLEKLFDIRGFFVLGELRHMQPWHSDSHMSVGGVGPFPLRERFLDFKGILALEAEFRQVNFSHWAPLS